MRRRRAPRRERRRTSRRSRSAGTDGAARVQQEAGRRAVRRGFHRRPLGRRRDRGALPHRVRSVLGIPHTRRPRRTRSSGAHIGGPGPATGVAHRRPHPRRHRHGGRAAPPGGHRRAGAARPLPRRGGRRTARTPGAAHRGRRRARTDAHGGAAPVRAARRADRGTPLVGVPRLVCARWLVPVVRDRVRPVAARRAASAHPIRRGTVVAGAGRRRCGDAARPSPDAAGCAPRAGGRGLCVVRRGAAGRPATRPRAHAGLCAQRRRPSAA